MSTKHVKKSRRKSNSNKEIFEYFKKPLKNNKRMEKEAVCGEQAEEDVKIQTVRNEEVIESSPQQSKSDSDVGEKPAEDKTNESEKPVESAEETEKTADVIKEKTENSDEGKEDNSSKIEEPVEDVTSNEPKPKETEESEDLVSKEKEEENVIETVQDEVVIVSTNGIKEDENGHEEDVEMEPLVIDNEEADPELQFDENSDGDSHKESPVVSRCRTRRSQTRNIPTPKTPKSVSEQNGDDASDKPSSTPEIPEFTEKPTDLNDTQDSVESSVSTKVNVGSDVTREIDLSFPDKDSFINTAKELTVVETMRRLSSRRSIHSSADYRKSVLKSNTEKRNLTLPHSTARSSVEKLSSGTKRKNRSTTPDGVKRFKPEPSQAGFLSYISSPLQKIRGKFGTKEVSASTPKLTGYRKADLLEEAEFSKIESESAVNPHSEKKWCSIM